MKFYRIALPEHADPLNAEGSRRFGGRWNPKEIGVVYYATSRSLAALERRAHVPAAGLGRLWAIIVIEIPDHYVTTISQKDLPKDWSAIPAPESTQTFGRTWHQSKDSVCILVPSTIIPEESNALVNPEHPDASKIKHIGTFDFRYDDRLAR